MTRNGMFAMKQAVAVCGSRLRMLLLAALLMGASLLVLPGMVPMAKAEACCQVTAVSGKSASAVDTKTKTTFEFTLTKPVSLRVGDAVYANFSKKEVSCDGKSICGTIISISPGGARTHVTPKTEGTTEGEARTAPATLSPKAEPGVPGCRITAIDAKTGEVSARETATGRTFIFAVSDASLRNSLKVDQDVHANFDTKEVSFDGKSVAGHIVIIGAPSLARVLIPPKGTVGSSGSSSSGSSSSGSSPSPYFFADPNCGPSMNAGLANSTPNDFGLAVYLTIGPPPPQLAQNCTLPVGPYYYVLLFQQRQFNAQGQDPFVPYQVFLQPTIPVPSTKFPPTGVYVMLYHQWALPVPGTSLQPTGISPFPFSEAKICLSVPYQIQVNVFGPPYESSSALYWGVAGYINVPAC